MSKPDINPSDSDRSIAMSTNLSPLPPSSGDEDPVQLTLGLSLSNEPPITPSAAAPPPPDSPNPRRRGRKPNQAPKTRYVRKKPSGGGDDADRIPPPYPWATDRPCRVHDANHLTSSGLVSVAGRVWCKKCQKSYEMGFDVLEEFSKIGGHILMNKKEMFHRAPPEWMSPALPDCRHCNEKNAVRPEIAGEEKTNWLFLFLGQMVGCCKHEDLKYFLSKNNIHRTAAKDRLVYLVYLCICKQLDPTAPFDL